MTKRGFATPGFLFLFFLWETVRMALGAFKVSQPWSTGSLDRALRHWRTSDVCFHLKRGCRTSRRSKELNTKDLLCKSGAETRTGWTTPRRKSRPQQPNRHSGRPESSAAESRRLWTRRVCRDRTDDEEDIRRESSSRGSAASPVQRS